MPTTDFNKTAAISDGHEAKKAGYKVPFGTVSITPKAKQLIDEAIERRWLTKGKYVKEFEDKFAALFGVKYGIAVSSGTDADAIACAILYDFGARRGDEIIIPALTFVATGNAVLQAGFKPVFVDVKRETLNIDPDKIEAAITKRTRAIMPVHLMGKPADMDKIMAIARKHKLHVIEDAAEAHGAEYKGKKIGAIGDMACFSLYAAHIITTIEGGMIITDNERMAEAARSLRNHGIDGKFRFRRIGFSSKMNEIEAAVGLGNVDIFHDILNKRRRNVLYLIEKFKKFGPYFIYVKEEAHEKLGPHAFSMIVRPGLNFTKDEFVAFLEQEGVDSRNLFYSIPTQTPSYAFMGHKIGDFPESEFCSNNGTHIGCHQDIEISQMDHVIATVDKFLKGKNSDRH
ncbi:MAG: DegT/DnrJ/EryC1/StrS family aminotransferase [Candidatus Omnitrophica bacterium]|nr:DegT/DnrJ/EryC1/StrS family aminotransferase [Candidatus Omnitrophota bacterium]